jgi:hypothetical protein
MCSLAKCLSNVADVACLILFEYRATGIEELLYNDPNGNNVFVSLIKICEIKVNVLMVIYNKITKIST